jgi:Ni,Fe-hydrogenase I large subunit
MGIVTLDPITRIEGQLAIVCNTDTGDTTTSVHSEGKMFRGFELILRDRNPRDACLITERICGV